MISAERHEELTEQADRITSVMQASGSFRMQFWNLHMHELFCLLDMVRENLGVNGDEINVRINQSGLTLGLV